MEEFEILGNFVERVNENYILIPIFQAEVHLFGLKKKYFEKLGIIAIPYYLDVRGYDRLLDVLLFWSEEIAAMKKRDFYEKAGQIDEVVQ